MTNKIKDVAKWMLNEIINGKELYQDYAVYNILEIFGDEFVCQNENGNLAIEKKVLSAFRKLSGDSVVWSRGDKLWRLREDDDKASRQQF
jgi:hypothetical protein